MQRFRGWIIAGSILLLLVLVVVGSFLYLTRRPFPDTSGAHSVSGISAPVEIIRDQSGVPHIYGETSADVYFGQGYAHAQDRFWQMEFWRRIGAGRLSEYFGEATLGTDRFMRTMGFRDLAQQEYESLPPSNRRALEAYAAGVNAYISERNPGQLGLEFALLQLQGIDVDIEPWEPAHTLTWLKIMAYDLGGNLEDELNRLDLLRLVGSEKAAQFYPSYREEEMPVIVSDEELAASLGAGALGSSRSGHAGTVAETIDPAVTVPGTPAGIAEIPGAADLVGDVDPAEPLAFGRGGNVGSNSWVIGGSRTTTGMPILAADLHLGVQMPSIWYEVSLHAGSDTDAGRRPLNVAGFSFAGVPGVIIGHNQDIAWGLTNVNPDVQDLYIERVDPDDPTRYLVEGSWREMQTRVEEITVHGRDEPVRHLVRETRNGPIITDATGPQDERSGFDVSPGMGTAGTVASNGEGAATTGAEESLEPPEGLRLTELSLRWTAFRVNRTFRSVYELNRARNFEEFREAASYFDIPAQNLVYADAAGNIGYQTPGLIPIRSRGEGTFPVPGWADDYQWQGYIPFDELPFVFNPEKDYIVTANNAVTSSNYRYHITSDYNHGYRAKRIAEMVRRDSPEVGLDDVAAQQGDTQYAAASEILPYLLDLDPEDVDIRGESVSAEDISEAQALLEAWNGRMEVDDPAAALYGVFYPALLAELTHDELPDSGGLRERMLGTTSRLHSMLRGILPRPRNPWWDNVLTPDTRETRDEILLRSLARALLEARETLGNNPDNWRWGEIHTITFRNQTLGDSGISVIESLFNRGPYEVPSGLDQVFSADFDPTDPYEVVNHASMRQIIDLSDLGASRMIHTTGQSGHPYNRHYADFAPMWRDVEFHAHMWDRGELLDGDFDLLRLDPES